MKPDNHELNEFLKSTGANVQAKKIPNNLKEYLSELYPSYTVNEQLKLYKRGYEKEPLCPICNSRLNLLHHQTCSKKCTSILHHQTGMFEKRNAKTKKTCLEKYGVESVNHLKETHQKRINTLISKYGAKVSPKTREAARCRSDNLNIKGRKSLLEKYGVTNPGQLKDHKEKCTATMLKNYGVDHYTKSAEFKEKTNNERLDKWQNNLVTIVGISEPELDTQANIRISFECNHCGKSETLASETFKWRLNNVGTPCSHCGNLKNGSKIENDLANFISQYADINQRDRNIIAPKEIDIFIPKYNIGIEVDGLFWHNSLRLPDNYHIEKTKIAEEKNIKLIHVFEDELLHKYDIVKSRILSLLGIYNEKIHARKCTVKEISPREANGFINKNHIQGSGRANVHLGLEYNNELVAVMTFLNGDISKSLKGWELNRFCTKQNTSVVGAAGKLFNAFVKRYKPDQVTSFADRRWSSLDAFYSKIGFKFLYESPPNYWYFKPTECKRIHRYALRKPKGSLLTERELRESEGYLRIYDCGSSKYIWTK